MGRSESSDSDHDRKRKSKRKDRRRSRSRSMSSDSSHSRHRSRKSSRDRRRSRSRSRSRSRERRRNRSRSRSRDRSSRASRKDRSTSRSRDRRSKPHHSDDDMKSTSSSHKHEKGIVKSNSSSSTTTAENSGMSLKDKIHALSVKSEAIKTEDNLLKPSAEALRKIENESFVQEHFSKTYNQVNPPQSQGKKKKKKKNKQLLQQNKKLTSVTDTSAPATLSHDDAIFGATRDTLHLSKFPSATTDRIDSKRREQLKLLDEEDDLIFGAMFCEKPEIRTKRWLEKLQIIRKRLAMEGYQ